MNIKNQFPIFKNYPELIYLDNAATTQKPNVVIEKELEFYQKYNANIHRGIYTLSEKATNLFETARNKVAKFINALPEEIIFTSGTTESINLIAQMLPEKLFFPENEDEVILTTVMEHHSNLLPWQRLTTRPNVRIEYLELLDNFQLNKKLLHEKFKNFNIKVLAITQMSNVLGTINPIKEIVQFVRKNSPQTIIVMDAAQSIAHLSIDVRDLDIDFLAFSGHKMYGPTGIGVLYGKKYLLGVLDPVKRGGGMINKVTKFAATWTTAPEKFEAGTPNIAGAIGLGAAIDFITAIGIDQIQIIENNLSQYFLSRVTELPQLKLFGPTDWKHRGSVFSLGIEKIHPHDIAELLSQDNIAVRAGHHCAQVLMHDVLKVPGTTRVSLSIYNSEAEIEQFFAVMKKIATIFYN
ncbi:MAG: SufS family cysteine desulfurase [bacterium]